MGKIRKIALIAILMAIVGILGMCAAIIPKERTTDCDASVAQDGLAVKGAGITSAQFKNAESIVLVAVEQFDVRDIERAAEIGVEAAIQESNLGEDTSPNDGSTSEGVFQQVQAWGPVADRNDPSKSSEMFFEGGQGGQPGLKDISNWQSLSRGDAAQRVQGSGYPDEYDKHENEAIALVARILNDEVASTITTDCEEPLDPIEIAVLAALSRTGDDYEWDGSNGSGLVSWAFSEAGITLPDELRALSEYKGNEDEGVEIEVLTTDDITSSDSLNRGDIVFTSEDGDDTPDDVSIEIGPGSLGAGSTFRIGTYNITVKRQFANYGLAVENITSMHKMDIVGTQELIGDTYRTVQQKVKAAGYGIYPDYAPGLRTVRHSLNGRAIIYNKERFVLDESQTTMFRHPRYPDDRPARVGNEEVLGGQANVPVAYFTDKVTGQPLIVVNFHNVAFARYARIRYQSNLILVEQMRQLQASNPGVPIFLTGDFNEGTGVRSPGQEANTTFEQKYENLLYCMFAENGLMMSTEEESRGQNMMCPNPSIGGVDYIYASQEVQVVPQSFTEIAPSAAGTDHPAKFVDVVIPGSDTEKTNIADKWLSVNVGRTGKQVNLTSIDSRRVVKVLRLTVTNTLTSSSGEWVFPLEKGVYTYSADSYGPRSLAGDDFHNGTDFGTGGVEAPLVAMHDGIIIESGYSGAWGNRLLIETGIPVPDMPGETFKYLYGHLSTYAFGISDGQEVQAGQHVGYVGNTGNSFGEHLHLIICTTMACTSGDEEGSTDPIPFLALVGIVP